MKKLALYLMIAIAAAACASKETRTEPEVTDKSTQPPTASASGTQGRVTPTQPNTGITGNELTTGTLAKRSVYFDFDSNSVKDEYRGLIQAHSRYMTDHRDSRIRIEGNCDERGTREYNLALGERRAQAVKNVLVALGIPASRISTISYGKERPAVVGSTEEAYAQNRRGVTTVN